MFNELYTILTHFYRHYIIHDNYQKEILTAAKIGNLNWVKLCLKNTEAHKVRARSFSKGVTDKYNVRSGS